MSGSMRLHLALLSALALMPGPPSGPGLQGGSDGPLVIAQIAGSVDVLASREVMERAYARLGVEVRFELVPADESLAALKEGRFGGETSRIDGASRLHAELVQVPIPINYVQGAAFSSKYAFPVRGWHSLRPYTIGIVRGILFAKQGTEGMQVRVAESYAELVGWIADGTVEVGVMPRINGLHALAESENSDVVEMEGLLETMLLYHYVHESRRDLVERLTPVLKKMLLDGTTRRLRDETVARLLGEDD